MWATMQAAEARVSVREGMPTPCIASDLQRIYRRDPARLWPHLHQNIQSASTKKGKSTTSKAYFALEHFSITAPEPSTAHSISLPIELSEVSQTPSSQACKPVKSTDSHTQSQTMSIPEPKASK
jgi:hypothetical protein